MDKFVLIGEKLSHSYSPLIHNHFYKKNQIDANYELMPIPKEKIKDVVMMLRDGRLKGVNITIPYKKEVIQYIDELSEEAKKIGAVNILENFQGKIIGHNTDYYGFINTLKKYHINPSNQKCFILGSGGASNAVYVALKDLGANVFIVSRNPRNQMITYEDLNQEKAIFLLVNTTPVGMYPNIEGCPINDEIILKSEFVVDLIYNPLETKLLSKANKGYNGMYLLISQAMCAEAIWYKMEINCTDDIDLYMKEVIK